MKYRRILLPLLITLSIGVGLFWLGSVSADSQPEPAAEIAIASSPIAQTHHTVSAQQQARAAAVTGTISDELAIDLDNDNKADPGDTISYTVVITNNGTTVLNNLGYTSTLSNASLISGSVSVAPVALADSYTTNGNLPLIVPASDGLLSDVNSTFGADFDPDGGSLNVTALDSSGISGAVSFAADGSFGYTPTVGFTGNEVLTYTITDDEGDSDSATLTIAVGAPIWFVDGAHGGSNEGSFTNPFQTIGAFNSSALTSTGDTVFIYTGTYGDGLNLLDSQVVVGQGADLSAEITLSPYAPAVAVTSNPTITAAAGNGVTLADGNTIVAVNIVDSDADGMVGNGISGATVVRNVNFIDTGAVGINDKLIRLENASGSFSFSDGSLDCKCGKAIYVTNSSSAVSFNNTAVDKRDRAAIYLSGNTSAGSFTFAGGSLTYNGFEDVIDVDNSAENVIINAPIIATSSTGGVRVQSSSGNYQFAAITLNGSDNRGVLLDNNPTATFTFSNTLFITTTNSRGFVANNSGTLSILNANGVISATGGAGIDIASTTLASPATFAHVSSSSSTIKGINLDGIGSAEIIINSGIITDSNGDGISLNAVGNVNLQNLTVSNNAANGISLVEVGNFTMGNSAVAGNANLPFSASASGTTTTCVDMSGNTLSAPTAVDDINLTHIGSSVFNVAQADAADLSTQNGNASVATTGTINFGVSCPSSRSASNNAPSQFFAVIASAIEASANFAPRANPLAFSPWGTGVYDTVSLRGQGLGKLRLALTATPDISLTLGILPVGEVITITYAAQLDKPIDDSVSQISEQGFISFDGGSATTSAATTTIDHSADLGISKTDGLTETGYGDTITYTVVLTNAADSASNVSAATFTDTLPAEFTLSGKSCVASGGATCGMLGFANPLVTTVNLPAGGRITYTLSGTVDFITSATFANVAMIAPPSTVTETTSANNTAVDITDFESRCFATADDGGLVFGSADSSAIQNAVDAANSNDTVKIAGLCVSVQNRAAADQAAVITKSVSLIGGYDGLDWSTSDPNTYTTTIDALGLGRIFFISDTVDVNITSLFLQNGSSVAQSSGSGGAIKVISSTVSISNTTVISSESRSDGGAITSNGDLTISNSLFEYNIAGDDGGAIDPHGELTAINNSIIRYNVAYGSGGGVDGDGTLNVTASQFISNTAVAQGGALNVFSSTAQLDNVTLFDNFASAGGGLFIDSGAATISDSVIDGNNAIDAGGGVLMFASSVAVSETQIVNNRALDIFGGGGGGFWVAGSLEVISSTISNNQALIEFDDAGGGFYIVEGSAVTVTASTIVSNSAPLGYGGAIFNAGLTKLVGSQVRDNSALDGGGVQNNGDLFCGPCMRGTGVDANLRQRGKEEAKGRAETGLSAISRDLFVPPISTTGTLLVVDSIMVDNVATDFGGGAIYNLLGTVRLTNTQVLSNSGAFFGGGISTEDGITTIFSSTIAFNDSAEAGGGIDNFESQVAIADSLIISNSSLIGAGVSITGTFATVTMTNSTVVGNSAEISGGGIDNNHATLSVISSTIQANSAITSGAGINTYSGTTTISASQVLSNTLFPLGPPPAPDIFFGGSGVANQNRGATTLIERSVVQSNVVSGTFAVGAGIVNKGVLTITHSNIISNSAMLGAGLANGGNALVTASTFSHNAGDLGSAITTGGALTLMNSTVSNNRSSFGSGDRGPGGSAVGVISGTLSITHSTIADNLSESGVFVLKFDDGAAITVTMSNTLVVQHDFNCTNIDGTLVASADNIDDDGTCDAATTVSDAKLGALADNDGATQTHALLLGSPAVDTASTAACLSTDQRDAARPQPAGGACDVGAYEAEQATLTLTKSDSADPIAAGDLLTYTIFISNTGSVTATGVVISDTMVGGSHVINNVVLAPPQASAVLTTTAPTLASGLIITPNTGITLTVGVTLNSSYSGTITNTAILSATATPIAQLGSISQTITTTAYTFDYQIGDATVVEGDSSTSDLTFTITRTNVPLATEVQVTTSDNTATSGSDFAALTGQTVSFASGEVTKTVTVLVNGDTAVEADETLTVSLVPVDFGTVSLNDAVGTIVNDDIATVTLTGGTPQNESDSGETASFVFTATLDVAVDGGFTISHTVDDGSATVADGDYVDNDGMLVFTGNAGETQLITITVTGDDDVESDETFTVTLGAITGTLSNSISSSQAVTATILNDDDDASIAMLDAVNPEGDSGTTAFTFVISRTGFDSGQSLAYTVGASGASPAEASDFAGGSFPSGSVTFGTGLTTTLTISVAGDTVIEFNESFVVTLTQQTRSLDIVAATAIGTIINDDQPLLIVDDVSVDEGVGNAVVTVALSAETERNERISYQTSDNSASSTADYIAQSGLLTITAGTTQTVFTIPITDDLTVEDAETLTVRAQSLGATSRIGGPPPVFGTVTILDNDMATVTLSGGTLLNEGDSGTSTLTFTATLDAMIDDGFTVVYDTVDGSATAGSDYVASSGLLTFTGSLSETQTFNVVVNGDTDAEASETFSVTLGAINGALSSSISTADSPQVVTIVNDDDDAGIAALDANKNEGNSGVTPFTFVISRTGFDSGEDLSYTVAGNGSDPAEASDFGGTFPSGAVSFNGGLTTTLTISVTGDTTLELDETFVVTLTQTTRNLDIVTVSATGTIQNDDAATLSVADVTVTEPSNRRMRIGVIADVAITLSAETEIDIPLTYYTSDITANAGDDYIDVSDTITVTAGMTNVVASVSINHDAIVENSETLRFAAGFVNSDHFNHTRGSLIGEVSSIITILDNDSATVTLTGGPAQNESDSGETASFIFTATLDTAVQGGFTLPYTTSDGTATTANSDYVDNDGALTFVGTAGETQTITVTVTGDNNVEADETFTVTLGTTSVLSSAINSNSAVSGTILNDDAATLSIADVTVDEGVGTALVTVTQSAESVFTTTVSFATSDNTAIAGDDYTNSSGVITLTPGVTQAFISVPIIDDALDENSETFAITLSSPDGATLADAVGVVTIVDNEDAPTIMATDQAVGEADGSVTVTFTLSAESSLDVGFDYATADSSALQPSDYISQTGRLTITAGMTQTMATFTIVNDNIAENSEQFAVNLSNPSNAQTRNGLQQVYLRTPTVNITINDDDVAGITVQPTSLTITESESATFTFKLDTQPTAVVTITLQSDDPGACSVNPTQIVVQPADFATPQVVTIMAEVDLDTNDENCTITDSSIVSDDAFYNGLTVRANAIEVDVTVIDRDITAVGLTTLTVLRPASIWLLLVLLIVVTVGSGFGRNHSLRRQA